MYNIELYIDAAKPNPIKIVIKLGYAFIIIRSIGKNIAKINTLTM